MAALRICCSQPPQAPRASRPFRKRTTTTSSSSSRRWSAHRHQRQQHAAAPRRSGTYERMDRAGNGRADFAGTGLAAVATAMSYLLHTVCGRNDPGAGGTPLDPFTTWQVILALGLMSAGLLLVMYGVRAPGARPPALVRGAADAAGALLWYAAGPERLLPLTLLLVLEAWFDFF